MAFTFEDSWKFWNFDVLFLSDLEVFWLSGSGLPIGVFREKLTQIAKLQSQRFQIAKKSLAIWDRRVPTKSQPRSPLNLRSRRPARKRVSGLRPEIGNQIGPQIEKFGENSEQNSGQNPGRKIEKFGKLSFCNFSDLKGCRRYSSGCRATLCN